MAISIGIGNYISRGLIRGGGIKPTFPEGLIARYACYDKTNEDTDRDVLKDLSGNGHDIHLYNFAFAEGSGYGKYHSVYTSFLVGNNEGIVTMSNNVTHISKMPTVSTNIWEYGAPVGEINIKFEIKGITDSGIKLQTPDEIIDKDGVYKISFISEGKAYFIIKAYEGFGQTCDIKITQIPEYKGALVSDGVDDYGFCDNFPNFTPDKGFTFIYIRENFLKDNSCFLYKGDKNNLLICSELNESLSLFNAVFDKRTTYEFSYIKNNKCSYFTSSSFNGMILNKGNIINDNNILFLFRSRNSYPYYGQYAFYALEIYDRDLTDEEIAKVKARMIAEYEAKTGEKYVEYLKLDQGKLDINKLK